jgi:hypothetical protein
MTSPSGDSHTVKPLIVALVPLVCQTFSVAALLRKLQKSVERELTKINAGWVGSREVARVDDFAVFVLR